MEQQTTANVCTVVPECLSCVVAFRAFPKVHPNARPKKRQWVGILASWKPMWLWWFRKQQHSSRWPGLILVARLFTSYHQFPPFLWYSAWDTHRCKHFKSLSTTSFQVFLDPLLSRMHSTNKPKFLPFLTSFLKTCRYHLNLFVQRSVLSCQKWSQLLAELIPNIVYPGNHRCITPSFISAQQVS